MQGKVKRRCHDKVRHSVYGDPTFKRDMSWYNSSVQGLSADQRTEWLRVHWPEEYEARKYTDWKHNRCSIAMRKWIAEHPEQSRAKLLLLVRSHTSPEGREALRKRMLKNWEDPAFAEKMCSPVMHSKIAAARRKNHDVHGTERRIETKRSSSAARARRSLLADMQAFKLPEV